MAGSEGRGLSANVLKIVAAVSMVADHAGVLLFPKIFWLRVVGRLAMPIFAWFIAEGMFHTRSPLKYFLRVFILAVACQIPYAIAERKIYLSILFTFSFSILIMWIIRVWRERDASLSAAKRAALFAALVGATAAVYVLCCFVEVDYGFFGVTLPVSAYLFRGRGARLLAFSLTLAAMSAYFVLSLSPGGAAETARIIVTREPQPFSALAIPLIALYSGRRGKLRMKYFFYIFYPAHLLILWAIAQIK